VTALSVIPRHDVPRNPSTSFGVPYRRDPLKRDVAPTMNDPVNVIMTQSVREEGGVREIPSQVGLSASCVGRICMEPVRPQFFVGNLLYLFSNVPSLL